MISDVKGILLEFLQTVERMEEKEPALIAILKKDGNTDVYAVEVAKLLTETAKLRRYLHKVSGYYFIVGGVRGDGRFK